MKVGDQTKKWAPHYICGTCRSSLEAWLRGKRKSLPFAIPRIWREPQNHVSDCYFCMVDITNFKRTKNRSHIIYPDISSSIAPVPHSSDLPIPVPESKSFTFDESASTDEDDMSQITTSDSVSNCS